MQIGEMKTISGPNVYSHDPVIVMKLGLGELYEKESYEIPGFIDRLLARLPGLHEHYCSLGRPGGFVERLYEGTYFGHTVEHVAIELSQAAGIPVNRGKTVSAEPAGWYLVAVTYRSEAGMKFLLRTAVELVEALIRNEPFPLDERLHEARKVIADAELGPSTRAVVDAAERRGIPWKRLDDNSLVRLGQGKYQRQVAATITDATRVIGVDLAGDKDLTKRLLAAAALPVPRGRAVRNKDEALDALKEIGAPVVVKPLDGNQGKGVSLNLSTEEQVLEAFETACQVSPRVLVEKMYRGNDYRVVVVGGKVVAAAERMPAHVWGDGTSTIEQLIEQANQDPLRGDNHEKPLTKIQADPIALAILKKHGRTLLDVPASGELVILRESANLSTGGSAKDVTDMIHPRVRRICERAAETIGLDVCGIDLVMPDISKELTSGGGIVEVNAAPGIRMHHYPSQGQPRDVGAAIVDLLFPEGQPSRLPIISITGTNGKTTVTRLIAHVVGKTGQRVGMTTTDGIWIGGEEIARGDMTGPWSAQVVLGDRTVEAAVFETARGGIVRSGLGYDWSDVSVITNFQADHLGQDGIESIEDIIRIKALVAERVREGGTLVLNADDPNCVTLPDRPKVKRIPKNIVWFSLHHDNPVVMQHLQDGGAAFVVKGGWIEEHVGRVETRMMRVASIPITMNGTADYQVANVLAAVAACRARGINRSEIANSVLSFQGAIHNEGRGNLFTLNGGYILVDYGHNPAALQAVSRTVVRWGAERTTLVLGLPGDRTDELLKESVRMVAGSFRHIILREDVDLRGRQSGELTALLRRVLDEEFPQTSYEIIPDEEGAVRQVLNTLQAGEVAVICCEDCEYVRRTVLEAGGEAVAAPDREHFRSSLTPAVN